VGFSERALRSAAGVAYRELACTLGLQELQVGRWLQQELEADTKLVVHQTVETVAY
jgi:hypothetical protein